MPERLKAARRRAVGAKQTLRALSSGAVGVVYVARDADRRVVAPVLLAAKEEAVAVVEVESMLELGRLCGIDVGAACAAVIT